MKEKVAFLAIFIMILIIPLSFSQEVSEKQDITIFELSYYDWEIPERALGSIDSEIQSVFINMGRFNVIGMTKRFSSGGDIEAFIQEIRRLKMENVEIPDEVNYGHMSFTKADLDRLVGSFVVILPEVTHLEAIPQKNDEDEIVSYEAELKTSYTVINAEDMSIVAKPSVQTSGSGETADSAVQDAIDSIASQLSFEIKSVSIFTLKTGVLYVYGGGITLEKGHNMGIKPGYEFKIVREDVLKGGLKRERDAALVVVNKVSEETSEATIAVGDAAEGDQLVEIPRIGAIGQVYVHVLASRMVQPELSGLIGDYNVIVGLKSTLAMGVYDIRPFLGIELPVVPLLSENAPFSNTLNALVFLFGIPANAYVGVEYNVILPGTGFSLAPSAAVGLGAIYFHERENETPIDPMITSVGGKAMLSISKLLDYNVMINAEVGFAYWLGLSSWINSYGGAFGGLGISFKL